MLTGDRISGSIHAGFGAMFVYLFFGIMAAVNIRRILLSPTGKDSEEAKLDDGFYYYNGYDLGISKKEIYQILLKHFPYFQKLDADKQAMFLSRLQSFMTSKIFVLTSALAYKEMPVLLSAAAVQITFGLKKYRLPHFRYIRVFPEEYFKQGTFHVLAGHVYGNGITVAWNHFLEGYKDVTNGINVGLHEMAHALYFESLFGEEKCSRFRSYYSEFVEEAGQYMQAHQLPSLFSKHAVAEVQELWAESIEMFFETPQTLYSQYPGLYLLLCQILNQQPEEVALPS